MRNRMRRYSNKTVNPLGPTAPMLGPFPLPSIEYARKLAHSYVAGSFLPDGTYDRSAGERVAQWIAATGDCVFHACSEVFQKPCFCQRCRPDIKRYC
jgi:hypothetical protein